MVAEFQWWRSWNKSASGCFTGSRSERVWNDPKRRSWLFLLLWLLLDDPAQRWKRSGSGNRPDLRTADELHEVNVEVDENDDERRRVPHGRLHFRNDRFDFRNEKRHNPLALRTEQNGMERHTGLQQTVRYESNGIDCCGIQVPLGASTEPEKEPSRAEFLKKLPFLPAGETQRDLLHEGSASVVRWDRDAVDIPFTVTLVDKRSIGNKVLVCQFASFHPANPHTVPL